MVWPPQSTPLPTGLFHPLARDETNLRPHETIFGWQRRYPETPVGYQSPNDAANSAATRTGDSHMRTFSFILAFAFIVAGPSLAGSSEGNLPGAGVFSYGPSAAAASAPAVMVAGLTLARRS
jgi:hypothetical protein